MVNGIHSAEQKIAFFQILNLLSLVSLTLVKPKSLKYLRIIEIFAEHRLFCVDALELFRDRTWYKKLRVLSLGVR